MASLPTNLNANFCGFTDEVGFLYSKRDRMGRGSGKDRLND